MQTRWFWTVVLIGLTASAAPAQNAGDEPMRFLAPYVNDSTFAVAQLDLEKIDVSVLFKRLGDVPNRDQGRREFVKLRAALIDAGVRKVYVRLNLAAQPLDAVLLVVPGLKAEGRDVVSRLFATVPGLAPQTIEQTGVLLFGSRATLGDLKTFKASDVPQLTQALASSAGEQRAAGLLPTPLKVAWEALTRTLPVEFGGGPIQTLTRGLRWVALGADTSKTLAVRVQVQAADAEAATSLNAIIVLAAERLRKDVDLPAKTMEALRFKVDGARLALALDERTIDAIVQPALARASGAPTRRETMDNLRQIALAFHNYHDALQTFPPQSTHDAQGKPLLSWRVHILPYVGLKAFYDDFKLDEPWDSDHNKKLIAKMPYLYRSPRSKGDDVAGKTTFVMPVGPELLFAGKKAPKLQEIADGSSNTILLLDVDDSRAVVWTQPMDLTVDMKMPKAGVLHAAPAGIFAVFCDGSVRLLDRNISDATFRALLTPRGGEVIGADGK